MGNTAATLGWWARFRAWWNPSPIPDRTWVREPTRSIYLIDDYCVALVVTMDVDSFPGYRWKVEMDGGATGVEPTLDEAETAAVRAVEERFSWL
jgi:hypothetical protein